MFTRSRLRSLWTGGVVAEPEHLRAIVEATAYRPGWEFRLGTFDGHPALWIITDDVDSYDQTKPMRVTHAFPVPVTAYGREEWEEWVLDRCLDVDRHEAGEFFMVDGRRLFAPRHGPGQNPYRLYRVPDEPCDHASTTFVDEATGWQCYDCGHVVGHPAED